MDMVENAQIMLLTYLSNLGSKSARKNHRDLKECCERTMSLQIKRVAVFGFERLEF